MKKKYALLLLTTVAICYAQQRDEGLVYSHLTPSANCGSGACSAATTAGFTYFSHVTYQSGSIVKSVSGVCAGTCMSPGSIPSVATWVVERNPNSPSQTAFTGYFVFNVGIPLPSAVGPAMSIVTFVSQAQRDEDYGNAVKSYYAQQREQSNQIARAVTTEVAAFSRDVSQSQINSLSSLAAGFGAAAEMPLINDKPLTAYREWEKVRESPFVVRETVFDATTLKYTLADLDTHLKTRRFDLAATDLDELANSNHPEALNQVSGLAMRDGVVRFEASDPLLPTSPLSGIKFLTASTAAGGQEIRRVANAYQTVWARSNGLLNYSEASVNQYVAGLTILHEADRSFAVEADSSLGFGYLRLSKTMLDVAMGIREGVEEALIENAKALPKLAKTILEYRLAIHSDPRQIVPIVNRLVTSVPGIARELVAQYRRSVETIKNGSVFDRAKLLSKLTVDVIIADATGGLGGEASASELLVADEGLANKAASSLERAVEKADNLGASDLRSEAVDSLVNAAEGKDALSPEFARLAWDDAKAGRVIGILRESSKYVGDFGLGSGTAQEADLLGKIWVGEGYRTSSRNPRILISADGLKQYRPPSFKPERGVTQANFDWRASITDEFDNRAHLTIEP